MLGLFLCVKTKKTFVITEKSFYICIKQTNNNIMSHTSISPKLKCLAHSLVTKQKYILISMSNTEIRLKKNKTLIILK